MVQLTQTPCPHCGDSVYVLATTCVHCRGPLRFNPAIEKGSLEAHRILSGWKQPKLPPIEKDMTARQAVVWPTPADKEPPMAERENPDDRLVSVRDVAHMLVDCDAKTLSNTDVKTWGEPARKINRARVWRWGDIKMMVTEKRQLKEA